MAMATSRSVLNLKFACIAALVMILAMNPAPVVVDAAMFTFTDNCLYYCQDCMVHGEQASLFSWLGCCPGVKRDSDKLNKPAVDKRDLLFGCIAYKCYVSALSGWNYDYTVYMFKRCNASIRSFTVSPSEDCFKALNYY
ncbi:hypothetical protein AKJ16_DCAP13180 [Drosera capensis]